MTRRSVTVFLFSVLLLLPCSFVFGAPAAKEQSTALNPACGEKPVYEVPEGKKEKWESIKNMVQKENNVCIEHCGNNTECLGRCENVYKTRLDREYKALMQE